MTENLIHILTSCCATGSSEALYGPEHINPSLHHSHITVETGSIGWNTFLEQALIRAAISFTGGGLNE